jgi:broad specificity phosphatase PhoE
MGLVHLIRHGRPAAAGLLLGSSDVQLADEEIAPSALQVDRVLTSPLVRALRTAQLLFPTAPVSVLPGLAERGLGEWEMKSWKEIQKHWPDLAAQAELDWFQNTPPAGEPWEDFMARVERVWRSVPRSGTTAIVAHAGVNSVLAHLADGREFASFQQNYLEVISLAFFD